MKPTFTQEQLDAFQKYVVVQRSGEFNMMDRRAQDAVGVDRDMYVFIMENYAALKKASEEKA